MQTQDTEQELSGARKVVLRTLELLDYGPEGPDCTCRNCCFVRRVKDATTIEQLASLCEDLVNDFAFPP